MEEIAFEKRERKKEKIIILIDGSNFYHITAKKGKRVNFQKLSKESIGEGTNLTKACDFVIKFELFGGAK